VHDLRVPRRKNQIEFKNEERSVELDSIFANEKVKLID
jgi:hypothetical protein